MACYKQAMPYRVPPAGRIVKGQQAKPTTKVIPLTRNRVAVVDEADFDALNAFKWCADRKGHTWYAVRKVKTPNGARLQEMGRFLMKLGFGDRRRVDHIDGDGLNYQRLNLRVVTAQQDRWNTRRAMGRSKLVGVSYRKDRTNCWRASIRQDGRFISLGYFADKHEAKRAYDAAAKKLRGEFAA